MPAPRVTDELLRQISDQIVAEFGPEQIILFGSHARGDPDPDSDVDLLVIMENEEPPAARSARVSRACRPRYLPMDIMVRTPHEVSAALRGFDPFLEDILAHGRTLYKTAG